MANIFLLVLIASLSLQSFADQLVELQTASGQKVQVSLTEIQKNLPMDPAFVVSSRILGQDGRATFYWPQAKIAGLTKYIEVGFEDDVCRGFGYSHSIGGTFSKMGFSSYHATVFRFNLIDGKLQPMLMNCDFDTQVIRSVSCE